MAVRRLPARKIGLLVLHSFLTLGLVAAAAAVSGPRPQAREAMPDLIVRGDVLAQQWVVRDEKIGQVCSAEEGHVDPGLRRIIRFTVMTPNIGSADIFVGDPNDHVAAGDGLFELATCHNHYHFRHYALYELVSADDGEVWKAAKRGFCMLDTDPNPAYFGQPPREGKYRSCGAVGIPGNQGITYGWADTYRFTLAGQYFVLDGGDDQKRPVPPGNYFIRITVNPPFTAENGEPCPHVDGDGLCHQLPESDYTNNAVEVPVFIPDHVGREGAGPLAGNTEAAVEDNCHASERKAKK